MIRLAVRVERAQAELVLAELLELAPSGVEEVSVSEDVVEYAVYGPPGELPALPDVRAAAGGALVEVATTEIADDWHERWREFHKPLVLDGLVVRPPWEPPVTPTRPSEPAWLSEPGGQSEPGGLSKPGRLGSSGTNSIELVIDPGQAFGTGAHATTRLCLELLLELPASGSFVDLGCGSGVLALAAARLGFSPVLALDYDPAAVQATIDNAAVNGITLEVRRHDLRMAEPPRAQTIAANLLGPLLVEWAARLGAADGSLPRRVIASGLLATETGAVGTAFTALGFRIADARERGDWAALLLERP